MLHEGVELGHGRLLRSQIGHTDRPSDIAGSTRDRAFIVDHDHGNAQPAEAPRDAEALIVAPHHHATDPGVRTGPRIVRCRRSRDHVLHVASR